MSRAQFRKDMGLVMGFPKPRMVISIHFIHVGSFWLVRSDEQSASKRWPFSLLNGPSKGSKLVGGWFAPTSYGMISKLIP